MAAPRLNDPLLLITLLSLTYLKNSKPSIIPSKSTPFHVLSRKVRDHDLPRQQWQARQRRWVSENPIISLGPQNPKSGDEEDNNFIPEVQHFKKRLQNRCINDDPNELMILFNAVKVNNDVKKHFFVIGLGISARNFLAKCRDLPSNQSLMCETMASRHGS